MENWRKACWAATSAGIAIANATPLYASSTPNAAAAEEQVGASERSGLEEIVVTARRREENLQKVPIAVSAIGGDQLTTQGVFTSTDLASKIPNLQISTVFGDAQPNFTIRGIGVGNEFSANQASPVGVYVDGAYLAPRAAHSMQLFDMARVEVLKGPQGTLYGRNTTGGAINFITSKPTLGDAPTGLVKIGYGNYDAKEVLAVGDVSLVPDKLGVRIAVKARHTGAMQRNLYTGAPITDPPYPPFPLPAGFKGNDLRGCCDLHDLGSNKSISGRVTVRFRPNSDVDLSLKGYISHDESGQWVGHAIGRLPGGVDATGYSRPSSLGFYDVETSYGSDYITRGRGLLFTGEFGLSDALRLTVLSGYDRGDALFPANTTSSPIPNLNLEWGQKYSQINEEVRINFDNGGPFRLTAGAYYGRDTINIDKNVAFTAFGFNTFLRSRQKRKSTAVYAEGEYSILDSLRLTLGARYTIDKFNFKSQALLMNRATGEVRNSIPTLSDFFSGQPAVYDPNAFVIRSKTNKRPTGRAILSYDVTDKVMVYGGVSIGYRAAAINGNADITDTDLNVVAPEKVTAYEAGVKSRFLDNRAQLNIAAFFYDYKDQQLQQIIGVASILNNVGAATVKGIEAELKLAPTEGLRFSGNLGLLDTKYKSLVLSGENYDGNEFPNAPHMTASLGGDWDFLHAGDGVATLHIDGVYTSKQFFTPGNNERSSAADPFNNSGLAQGGYFLLNGRISYETDGWSLGVWGKNLTQKHYYAAAYDVRAAFGSDILYPGRPRTYGVDFTVKF